MATFFSNYCAMLLTMAEKAWDSHKGMRNFCEFSVTCTCIKYSVSFVPPLSTILVCILCILCPLSPLCILCLWCKLNLLCSLCVLCPQSILFPLSLFVCPLLLHSWLWMVGGIITPKHLDSSFPAALSSLSSLRCAAVGSKVTLLQVTYHLMQ